MTRKLNEKYMRLAIQEARKNLKSMDGGPFGACIVRGLRILAVARNSVLKNDATCHAEINAIRKASKRIKNFNLSGCIIYSTTEPCPMCFSAIHWARIGVIAFGTSISDVSKRGFKELCISNFKLRAMGKSKVKVFSAFLRGDCKKLLEDWDKLEHKKLY